MLHMQAGQIIKPKTLAAILHDVGWTYEELHERL
jgi:hypothetical protein